jgi:diacylglycerol O-acyltransferase / wax synthase
MKSLYPDITKSTMHRAGGALALLSGRAHGQVFVSVLAYRPSSSKDDLRQDLSNTLNDFSLTGTTGWRRPTPVGRAQ